ncbi:MAG: nitroreductase family protein [Firmicutes bacterium]|nr:nitroreductase family protein [Bacillota bacterium]
MELLELMKTRRSIRKYLPQRVEKEKLLKIQEAGLFAPNPGGRQGTKIIIVDDPELIDRIGVVNANCENRNWDIGVSSDQPSIIDDKSIKSGFYSAPALGIICVDRKRKHAVNNIGAAFVCAQNMVLEAFDMGVSSCIVGRAEATFSFPEMQAILDEWGLDPEYMPMVFVCLGYINGDYPKIKARNDGRALFISKED